MTEKTEKVNESQIDFLKPCPFCDCQDIETIDYSINIEGVLCLGCGAFVIAKDGTKDSAIELWNRRVKG